MNFEIHYCDFHKVNPIRDKIDRPTGSGDYLILHFLTPMVLNQMGEYINVQSGGCILFTPNMPQQYQAINRFVNSYIHFELDNPSIFDELDIPKNKIFYPTISDKIDLCFRQLHIENIEKNLHYEKAINLLMEGLFVEISRQIHRNIDHSQIDTDLYENFRHARIEILSHPERNWNTSSMSMLTNMGTSQFYSYYKKFFGSSPKSELLDVRLERAKYLLKTESTSIADVAIESGFNNLSHFTRYFKKAFGVSPTQFREE
ncbi:MAG: AraC family transcriptional regulator [Agathobacter sp.]|nr:AraC family transcriptional regulator [Agathobacter sp.]